MSEVVAEGREIDILFWVGCAGSYDARAQKVTLAMCKLLDKAGVSFAILGDEENCTGDPARRAGNEFLFQMMALQNIETLNAYNIKKIVTACPHCFNTIKNEYPVLGGTYDIVHHTQLIQELLEEGKITVEGGSYKGKKITYHDSCYLGRVNGVYEAPRAALSNLEGELIEMKRCKTNGLCCGAGGAQMFKENEPGEKRINIERAEEAVATGAEIVAANCPFCLTMIKDGVSAIEKEENMMVLDISEMIVNSMV